MSRIAKDNFAVKAMPALSKSTFSQILKRKKKRNELLSFTITVLALLGSRGKLSVDTILVDEASNGMEVLNSSTAMEAPLGTRAHQENGGIETERDPKSDVTAGS